MDYLTINNLSFDRAPPERKKKDANNIKRVARKRDNVSINENGENELEIEHGLEEEKVCNFSSFYCMLVLDIKILPL